MESADGSARASSVDGWGTKFSTFCQYLFPNPPSHVCLQGYQYLPSEIRLFHRYILQSRKGLFVYYLFYLGLIAGFIFLIVTESKRMFDEPGATFYNSYFLFQTFVLLLLFPFLISFLRETLGSSDIPQMLHEVVRYEQRFQSRIRLLSTLNSSGFVCAVLLYGISVLGDPFRRASEVIFFLVVLFPLPLCITMSLVLMDCHRRLADRFVEYLKFPTASHLLLLDMSSSTPASSIRANSNFLFSGSLKFHDLSSPLLSMPIPLSDHIQSLHSQYLTLRDGYLLTSSQRGFFISLLSLNSLMLMVYLLWTVYRYSFSFLSVLGFMVVDLVVLVEVFVWASLANESGHLVREALADHTIRLLTQDGITAEQVQMLTHLVSCLPHARLEVYGIGRVVVRFKFAVTITVGFAAAIIPKLIVS
jgi:hypothetical protein